MRLFSVEFIQHAEGFIKIRGQAHAEDEESLRDMMKSGTVLFKQYLPIEQTITKTLTEIETIEDITPRISEGDSA